MRLRWPASAGRRAQTAGPLLTVQEVCRRLRKSRRQVYRYLRSGRLSPCGRILGQWLFDERTLDRFGETSLPGCFRRFFWDVPLSGLSVERHRDFIMGRLLEWGDWEALRWVWRIYPRTALKEFLRGRGTEVLSRRNRAFWLSLLGEGAGKGGGLSWRSRGRWWGGIS